MNIIPPLSENIQILFQKQLDNNSGLFLYMAYNDNNELQVFRCTDLSTLEARFVSGELREGSNIPRLYE